MKALPQPSQATRKILSCEVLPTDHSSTGTEATDPSGNLAIEVEWEAIGVAREGFDEAPRQIGQLVVLPASGRRCLGRSRSRRRRRHGLRRHRRRRDEQGTGREGRRGQILGGSRRSRRGGGAEVQSWAQCEGGGRDVGPWKKRGCCFVLFLS